MCLGFEMDHPQVLVMGGMDRNGEVCSDMWLLDVVSGRWSEVRVLMNASCVGIIS